MESHPITHNHLKLSGPLVLFKKACNDYKLHFKFLLPILAVLFFAGGFQVILKFTSPESSPLFIIGTLLALILIYFSHLALLSAIIHPREGNATVSDFYQKAGEFFFSYLLISILTALFVIAGFVLFIIPGIILSVFLSLGTYILISENKHGMEAITRSWHYIEGNWWKVFGRMIVFFLIIACMMVILSVLISITGIENVGPRMIQGSDEYTIQISLFSSLIDQAFQAFVVSPLSVFFLYLLYRELRDMKVGEHHIAAQNKIKKTLYIVTGLSVILVITIAIVAGAVIIKILPAILEQMNQNSMIEETTLSIR